MEEKTFQMDLEKQPSRKNMPKRSISDVKEETTIASTLSKTLAA